MTHPILDRYLRQTGNKSPEENLQWISEIFGADAVFSTSFGLEDQVIAHILFSGKMKVEVFTLDTGRMFPETYSAWTRTLEAYQQPVQVYYPDTEPLEKFTRENGPNAFYDSVEKRKACCNLRKVEPLKRALAGKKIWITGIRRDQSQNRERMEAWEEDKVHNLFKFHPLFHWTWEEVRAYVKQHNIPYNSLHDRGFPSIGCAPCTRALEPGEDFRAGRWWWENNTGRECGLHSDS